MDAYLAIFLRTAIILIFWLLMDWWLIKDVPDRLASRTSTPATPPPAKMRVVLP